MQGIDRKILIDIGEKCRQLRDELKMTAKELALELKVPVDTLRNFEYGKVNNAVLYHQILEYYNNQMSGV